MIQILIIISVISIVFLVLYRYFYTNKVPQSVVKSMELNHHRKHAIASLLIEKDQLTSIKRFIRKSLVIEKESENSFYSKHMIINYKEEKKFVNVSILASNNSLTEEVKRKIKNEIRDINQLNSRSGYEYFS
ncbi:MAG: hypothetical protein GF329_16180 [Candidatus Lokiarchaeota archaeon]|nr:hypothetical protein [Candidatus Lokiarchaeota archaeon]